MNRREVLGGGLALALAGRWAPGQETPPAPKPHTVSGRAFGRDEAEKLMPAAVFFAGKVASIQMRNTGGASLADRVLVVGLVDSSGYSSGIQEKYQAYLLSDAPTTFGDHLLEPGAYGCGVVNGQLLVMNLAADVLWTVPAERDAELQRPTPLQVLEGSAPGEYRLCFGRNCAGFMPAGKPGTLANTRK